MKIPEVRLFKEPNKSFISYHEKNLFSPWHCHPEYELCLILQGRGIRTIGDHVDRFKDNDLVLTAPYLPHEWRCDDEYIDASGSFQGEGMVIQFLPDFLGELFFELPENASLKKCFQMAELGCRFHGSTSKKLISLMKRLSGIEGPDRLYSLFSVFHLLATSNEYMILANPLFQKQYSENNSKPMRRAVQFILQNFQRKIKTEELLEITNMANTTFFEAFKKAYRMSYKRYLLKIRIGYACRLLTDDTFNISGIAFESGFENLSNFNRQFKQIKGCTPRDFKRHMLKGEQIKIEAEYI